MAVRFQVTEGKANDSKIMDIRVKLCYSLVTLVFTEVT
jgi:hypothetical protein